MAAAEDFWTQAKEEHRGSSKISTSTVLAVVVSVAIVIGGTVAVLAPEQSARVNTWLLLAIGAYVAASQKLMAVQLDGRLTQFMNLVRDQLALVEKRVIEQRASGYSAGKVDEHREEKERQLSGSGLMTPNPIVQEIADLSARKDKAVESYAKSQEPDQARP